MKHQFKVGDGVVCSSPQKVMKLLKLAKDNGYNVHQCSLYATNFDNFYYDSDGEFCGCGRGCIGNIIPEVKFIEFITSENTNMTKDRKLNTEQAKQIIDVACSVWKPKLTNEFKDLLWKEFINIEEKFYQEMRAACTDEQHKLFDTIFGKDEEVFYVSNLKIGEAAKILTCSTTSNVGIVILRTYDGFVDIYNPQSTWGNGSFINNTTTGKKVKLTISHEIIK
jgi:hypothetical protein